MFLFGHLGLTAGLVYLAQRKFNFSVDYRYVILGSMLPDIIDKPLGNIILYNVLNNGRIIGHSLLFVLLLTLIGIYRKNIRYLAYGVWIHLVLDAMWLNPLTLLWPLLGDFKHTDFAFSHFAVTIQEPYNFAGEVAGLAVVAYLVGRYKLYRIGNLKGFMRI